MRYKLVHTPVVVKNLTLAFCLTRFFAVRFVAKRYVLQRKCLRGQMPARNTLTLVQLLALYIDPKS